MAACLVLVGIGYLMLDVLSELVATPRTPVREVFAGGEQAVPLSGKAVVCMQASEDGLLLAYVDQGLEGGETALNIVGLEGRAGQVFSKPVKGRCLAWLGMGHSLVYEDGGDIYRLDADTGEETNLTASQDQDGEPLPSPDGRRILWTRTVFEPGEWKQELWVMNPDGSEKEFVASGADLVTWDPSGSRVVSRYQTSGAGGGEASTFLQITTPGMGRWELYVDCGGDALYVWWPRQDKLIFVSPQKPGGQDGPIGVWVLIQEPSSLKKVASSSGLGSDAYFYRFFPSRAGAKLAYVGEKGLECMDYDAKTIYRFPGLEAELPLAWNEKAGEILYTRPDGIYAVALREE